MASSPPPVLQPLPPPLSPTTIEHIVPWDWASLTDAHPSPQSPSLLIDNEPHQKATKPSDLRSRSLDSRIFLAWKGSEPWIRGSCHPLDRGIICSPNKFISSPQCQPTTPPPARANPISLSLPLDSVSIPHRQLVPQGHGSKAPLPPHLPINDICTRYAIKKLGFEDLSSWIEGKSLGFKGDIINGLGELIFPPLLPSFSLSHTSPSPNSGMC